MLAFNEGNGIPDNQLIVIQKILDQLDSDNKNSYLAYEQMKMYVYGGDPTYPNGEDPLFNGNTDLELLFRIGKDDDYYEITQDIYEDWDDKNETEIAYLGLLEEYHDKKLGSFLLSSAIKNSFQENTKRVWVHTCSLDHKNALHNYIARGMKIFKKETISI